jgi:hypothetical protein
MAIYFNGSTDFLNCGNTACAALGSTVTKISASIWFKVEDFSNKGLFSLGTLNPVSDDHGLLDILVYSSPPDELYLNLEKGNQNVWSAFMNDGKFHNAIITYDGADGNLYVDGAIFATGARVFTLDMFNSGNNNILIGNYYSVLSAPYYFFDGQLADARVYNRVLSQNEISTIFYSRGGDKIVTGLVLRVPCIGSDGVAVSSTPDISKYKSTISEVGTPAYLAAPLRSF